MADLLNGIFFSEILADNAGGAAIDTDGDGNTNKADEFIELQNASGGPVDLSGYQIWSEKGGLLFTFGSGETINSGENATVVGNYTGTPPAGFYSAGLAENGNWLPDGEGQKFDSLFLVDPSTGDYIVFSYGTPPRAPTPPAGFTGTNQVGPGESIDSSAPNGTAFARNADGIFEETTPTPGDPNVACFTAGTLITTDQGEVTVEDLTPGMRIWTMDHGYQVLRAVGCFRPKFRELWQDHNLVPVTFPPATIGNSATMSLSGSHRILHTDPNAELMFGTTQVLISARQYVGHQGVVIAPFKPVPVYYHLLLDHHEIIAANGAWAESLFLDSKSKPTLTQESHWICEAGLDLTSVHHGETARTVLKRFEARILLRKLAGRSQPPRALAA